MKTLNEEIITELKTLEVDFVYFVDISKLSYNENKGFPNAILFGFIFTPEYIQEVSGIPDYVQKMIDNGCDFSKDELYIKELKANNISDKISEKLINNGYLSYSLSEENQIADGTMDNYNGKTPLPHKKIAMHAGLGWIGKNNLLISYEYGTAFSTGAILTGAPLKTVFFEPVLSKCGNCSICISLCDPKALKGKNWTIDLQREDIIDVQKCSTCFKCSVFCPYTQKYKNKFVKDRDNMNKIL